MKRNKLALASALTVGSLMTVLTSRADDQALPSPFFPDPVIVQLKTENFDIPTIDRIYDMGFRGFRRAIYWSGADLGDGVYDFSKWDQEFKHAHEKGMKMVVVWFGNNKIHEDDPGVGGIQTEAGRQAFARFAAAAAEHYKDYDIMWEVWNEPNVRTFWRKNKKAVGSVPPAMHNSEAFADEYTALVKAIAKAVLEKDPDAFILAGSVSNYWTPSYEWTEYCFQKGILDCGIKGWSVHPYGVKRPEDFTEGHDITRGLLKKYGHPDMPMVNTERGFSIDKHQGGGEIANEGWSGGPAELAHIFQAWHYVRQFMMDQVHGLRATSWYELGGDKFGLVKDRPVVTAAKVMSTQLDGYQYVRRLASADPLDYVLLWQTRDGAGKLVAWTAPPPGGAPDQARNHDILVEGVQGDIAVVDLAGKSSTVSGAPAVFPVSGSPLYIELPDGVTPGEVVSVNVPVAD